MNGFKVGDHVKILAELEVGNNAERKVKNLRGIITKIRIYSSKDKEDFKLGFLKTIDSIEDAPTNEDYPKGEVEIELDGESQIRAGQYTAEFEYCEGDMIKENNEIQESKKEVNTMKKKCEKCNKAIGDKDSLKRMKCKECGKKFKSKSLKESEQKCPKCGGKLIPYEKEMCDCGDKKHVVEETEKINEKKESSESSSKKCKKCGKKMKKGKCKNCKKMDECENMEPDTKKEFVKKEKDLLCNTNVDILSILKNPLYIKSIITESRTKEDAKELLAQIIEMVETKGDEVKKAIGDTKFYMVKTEIASSIGMMKAIKRENKMLSEEIYWEKGEYEGLNKPKK